MAPGIFLQLFDNHVLNTMEELHQPGGLWCVTIMELREVVKWVSLGVTF